MSNSKFVLVDEVFNCLRSHPEKRFTARAISEYLFEQFPDEVNRKRANSTAKKFPLITDHDFRTQWVAEISSQRTRLLEKYTEVKTIEVRPREYYYTLSSDEEEVDASNQPDTSIERNSSIAKISEHYLYPILSEYLRSELSVWSIRIDEKRSKNSRGPQGNRWLFPDLVGLEDLSEKWPLEIKETVREYGDRKTELWSFEVKKLINSANVREVFFQAVSNSSWANFGYLVASDISGPNTMRELRMLSGRHGIGVIELDVENPSESQIVIPASKQNDVDWDLSGRLSEQNVDFKEFMKLVKEFYQTGNLKSVEWESY